jgi:hypothetical protein
LIAAEQHSERSAVNAHCRQHKKTHAALSRGSALGSRPMKNAVRERLARRAVGGAKPCCCSSNWDGFQKQLFCACRECRARQLIGLPPHARDHADGSGRRIAHCSC